MNPDGSDLRQLTDNPADDAQSDWAPDGRDIVYRIRKPGFTINFEVARMTAAGAGPRRLTFTTGRAVVEPAGVVPGQDRDPVPLQRPATSPSIWQMGPLGEDPVLRYDPPARQWYPSLSPDMSKVLFATTISPTGDTDRGVADAQPPTGPA